jgi:hypothetical protein
MDHDLKSAVESMHRLNPEWNCTSGQRISFDRISFNKLTDDGVVSGELEYYVDKDSRERIHNAKVHYKVNNSVIFSKCYDNSSWSSFFLGNSNVSFIENTIKSIFKKNGIQNLFESYHSQMEALEREREKEQKLKNKYLS